MDQTFDTEALRKRIEDRYFTEEYKLGWRLLYSPVKVLYGARVAFIGLNPGGDRRPADHAEFAMDSGSAYKSENWGSGPGRSPLQRQVIELFRKLGERPEDVLAGNLVPFRSPSWEKLKNKKQSLEFGKQIWKEIFDNARPQLVICMGTAAADPVKDILNVSDTTKVPVGWGKITGSKGSFSGGNFVQIPHLSRFGIISRPESADGLKRLLGR